MYAKHTGCRGREEPTKQVWLLLRNCDSWWDSITLHHYTLSTLPDIVQNQKLREALWGSSADAPIVHCRPQLLEKASVRFQSLCFAGEIERRMLSSVAILSLTERPFSSKLPLLGKMRLFICSSSRTRRSASCILWVNPADSPVVTINWILYHLENTFLDVFVKAFPEGINWGMTTCPPRGCHTSHGWLRL